MNTNVLRAVFKRNFFNYFSNPTGYVFIFVFVVLSSLSAFWPNEFFIRNLANLDQLSFWFPLIMLAFIPAITMSIWADERRQATDELLLTIPATDFDVVLGKYLAAVAIFSVSLVFSMLCNYLVLNTLASGDPGFHLRPYIDPGLFLGTYIGYWLIGLAMLGIGMVASFVTGNLTVAYILGAAFASPLVFTKYADSILDTNLAMAVKQWSVSEQFRDFGRGVLSLSGLTYFVVIVAVMLYLSMVFIGRRHWRAGQGTMPNAVFYPVLHLIWLASFVTFGLFLHYQFPDYPGTNIAVALAVVYVLLHAALLWAWTAHPQQAEIRPIHVLTPVLQIALLGLFVVGALVVIYRQETPEYMGKLLTGLLAVYAVAHVALAFAWCRFPHRVSLMPGHYLVRFLALVLGAVGLTAMFHGHDLRWDITAEKLSSLSPATRELLAKLEPKRTVQIEAFISPEVPELYVPAKLNLISTLQEIKARSGDKVQLRINNTEMFSEQAERARRQFNIAPKPVSTPYRGTYKEDQIFMGFVVSCGRDKVVVPFLDRGISPEYELARSLATVTQQKRKKLGVLLTDVPLMSRFDPQGGNEWPIIEELRKEFDVAQVDASSPITEKYDVLLAVQPSSLSPEQFDNFLAAVRSGQPTAIFEDPFPYFAGNVPGTSAPRRPPGGMNPMMMMQQPNLPKGDVTKLWDLLGVRFSGDQGRPGDQVVYQHYNPLKKLMRLDQIPEFVFIDNACGAKEPFDEQSPVTSKLQHVLFPFPGFVDKLNSPSQLEDMKFEHLVITGRKTGQVGLQNLMNPMAMFGMGGDPLNRDRATKYEQTAEAYTLAAHIRGRVRPNPKMAGEKAPADDKDAAVGMTADEEPAAEPKTGDAKPPFEAKTPDAKPAAKGKTLGDKTAKETRPAPTPQGPTDINVILVCDIDMLHQAFFDLRAQGEVPELGLTFDFDNVTFVLNVLDYLAEEKDFIAIRSRRPAHRTLAKIDQLTEDARKQADTTIRQLQQDFDKLSKEEDDTMQKDLKALEDQIKREKLTLYEAANRLGAQRVAWERKKNNKLAAMKRRLDDETSSQKTELNSKVTKVQNWYKFWAVVLPPILPFVLGLVVFISRRMREREGVSRSRLRG